MSIAGQSTAVDPGTTVDTSTSDNSGDVVVNNQQVDTSATTDESLGVQGSAGTDVMDGDGGDKGGEQKDWYADLPEDIRVESVTNHKTVESLAKSYIEAQQLVGKKTVDFDGMDKLSDEQRAEVWAKMGVPEKAEDYKVEGLPEELQTEFQGISKDAGLTQEQANKFYQSYQGFLAADQDKTVKATTEDLKSTWGSEYEANLAKVKATVQSFGIGDVLDKTGLGNNADVIKMLAKVSTATSGDGIRDEQPTSSSQSVINARIREIRQDVDYTTGRNHSRRRELVEELSSLYDKRR